MSFAKELRRAERSAQRPYNLRGPMGGGMFGGGRSGPPVLNPIFTQAQGAQLFIDAAVAPGAVDGAAIPDIPNLSGSNAVFDTANNWGHGVVPRPTYGATVWSKSKPAVTFDSGQGCRYIGSDLAGCINGVAKSWYYFLVFQPVMLSGTTLIPGGFTASAGAQFASGMLTWVANWSTPGTPPVMLFQGQPSANVADNQKFNWEPLIFECFRVDATHVQSAFQGVDSTPVAYGPGTNFAGIDAFTFGGWNNVSNNGMGNTQYRLAGAGAYSLIPNRATVRAAIKARFAGFDWQQSLGAP